MICNSNRGGWTAARYSVRSERVKSGIVLRRCAAHHFSGRLILPLLHGQTAQVCHAEMPQNDLAGLPLDELANWQPLRNLEPSVTGCNLRGSGHGEFSDAATRKGIGRSIFFNVVARLE